MADTVTGRPLLPSGTKLDSEKRVSAVEAQVPNQKNFGWDVSDWQSVLVTVHPSNPLLSAGSLPDDAQITLRVWRWRSRAACGEGRPDGQWFCDEDILMTLSGNPANGPMEWILATKNAERMHLQVVAWSVVPPFVGASAEIGLYGLGEPRTSTSEGSPFSAGNNPENPADPVSAAAGAAAYFPVQDALLSNLAGDFTATFVDVVTVECVGVFDESLLTWLDSSHVVMVGRKPDSSAAGTETEFTLHTRGGTLDCALTVINATTFRIQLETAFFELTDELIVYIEGPKHRYSVVGIDGTKRQQVRSEAFTIATQSERTEEIDPLDQRYVPDILADGASVAQATTVDFYLDMAGYRFMTIQWIPADANFILLVEMTDEDNGTAPASCDYTDVTLALFGAATFTATQFLFLDVPTFVKYVHIDVTRPAAVGTSTHKLYTRRGW
jgi:hypothetical protein